MKIKSILNWGTVNHTLPHAKLAASAVGWINSAATTIISTVQMTEIIYLQKNTSAVSAPMSMFVLGMLIGLFFFLFLTGGQIYALAAKNQTAYAAFLIPDVAMTGFQWRQSILLPLATATLGVSIEILIGTWAIGIGIGILSAKLPEWLTFGKQGTMKQGRPQTAEQGGALPRRTMEANYER